MIRHTEYLQRYSNNGWDEQPLNDEIVGYVTPFNLYDPALESIDYFSPGGLYAQGTYPISATTNNWGNTLVDFDITATVFTADPDTVQCGDPVSDCIITFDNSTDGTRYTESNNPKGALYNDTVLCPSDIVFNNEAYWFGHPCLSQTGTLGYGDAWENETMSIIDVDMTSLEGDFVSMSFEYYADTFYEVDSDGTKMTRVVGHNYEVVAGNDFVNIKGTCNLTIDQNCNTYIKGNWNIQVDGSKTEVIKGSRMTMIMGADTLNIAAMRSKVVGAAESNSIGGAQTDTVGGAQITSVGGYISRKAGAKIGDMAGGTYTATAGGFYKVTAPRIDLN